MANPLVRVGPKEKNPTHDIALSDEVERWGLRLDGGIQSVQEISQTPSTIFRTGGGKKYGSGDPAYSHEQQDSWHGGRGLEDFSDDDTGYYSGKFLWSQVPGQLTPAPLWRWAETDHRDYNMYQPTAGRNVDWRQLRDTTRYFASSFTVAAQDATNYAADKAYVLIRRRGTPGTLTVELWTNTAGAPNAIISGITATITTTNVPDIISLWRVADWTGTTTLTHGTVYWIVVYGASTDNASNHWEVAVDAAGTNSVVSSAGSTWSSAGDTMYFRVVNADVASKAHGFFLGTDMYYVTQPASGNSAIYAWDETNDEWDGTGTLAPNTISNLVSSVAVSRDIAFMARSTTENIFAFDNGSGFRGRDDATAGNTADRLLAFNDPIDGPQIWRAENDIWSLSRSNVPAWASNLSFGTDIALPRGYDILKLARYNSQVWIRATDSLWNLVNDVPIPLDVGLDSVIEQDAYDAPVMPKDVFLFFGWWASVERFHGGVLDDVGPWKRAGLPDGFQGVVSAMAAGVGMDFVAVDGGTANISSVYAVTNSGQTYHPIWEAWEAGQRVRNLWLQSQNGTTNPMRLWISVGMDTVYIDFPDASLNPTKDADQAFCWEGVVESASHDMGASSLPKLFKEMATVTRNLSSTAYIGVDYQIDDNVGSTTAGDWIQLTELYNSPRDTAELNLGEKERIRVRLRLINTVRTTPVILQASVMKGIARTPVKRQWNMRIKVGDLMRTKRGTQDHDPRDFYRWLSASTGRARALYMESNEELMHGIYVFAEPPSLFRKFLNTIQGWLGASVAVTLREA